MGGAYAELYVHMVWATVQRRPLLTAEVWPRLKGAFRSIGHRIGVDVMEVGGVDDHVHVLVRMPTTLSVATVAKHLKGASSHLINRSGGSPRLRWQGGLRCLHRLRSARTGRTPIHT